MLEFRIDHPRIDSERMPQGDGELLLRPVCELTLRLDRETLFREVEFPFVELASQLAAWLTSVADFELESMEGQARGLIYFRHTGEWQLLVGSEANGVAPRLVDETELRRAVLAYIFESRRTAKHLGLEVDHLLVGNPSRPFFQLECASPGAAYLRFRGHPGTPGSVRSVPLSSLVRGYEGPDVVFDFDANNALVGIEILDEEDG